MVGGESSCGRVSRRRTRNARHNFSLQTYNKRLLLVLRLDHPHHNRQFLLGFRIGDRDVEQQRNRTLLLERECHTPHSILWIEFIDFLVVVASPAWKVFDDRAWRDLMSPAQQI